MRSGPVLPRASYCDAVLAHQCRFRASAEDAELAFNRLVQRFTDAQWQVSEVVTSTHDGMFGGSVLVRTPSVTALVSVAPPGNFHWSDAPEYVAAASFSAPDDGEDDRRSITSTLDLIALTSYELGEIRRQFPLTQRFAMQAGPDALRGLAVFTAIHHMTDFVAMMDALVAMGVDPADVTILDKGYPYTQRHRVDGWLRDVLGLRVFTYPERSAAVLDHIKRYDQEGKRSIIVDDGGHVLPIVLREYPEHAEHFIGVVEQTVSGIWKLAGLDIPVPVFSVAESQLKAAVESYGVALAGVNSMLSLIPHEKVEGQAALVVGYGRIGRQVANVLRARKMRVSVFDKEIVALVTAHEEGFTTSRSLGDLITNQQPLLVIGTAGRNSLRAEHLPSFRKSAYLASITSRTYEFNQEDLRSGAIKVIDHGRLGHSYLLADDVELCLLGHGMPVNFYHAESLPNRYIDLVVSSLLLGATTLNSAGQGGFQPGHNLDLTNAVLNASPALDTYYDWYGERSARRELLSPRAIETSRDYAMPPWTFETHSTADGAA